MNVLVREYISDVINLLLANKIDETQYMQPLSRHFLQKVFPLVLGEYGASINLYTKNSGHNYTKYTTNLELSTTDTHQISGETDISLCHNDICMLTWEDKRAALNRMFSPGEMAQVLSEVKGNAETYKQSVSLEPIKFCGIITSGTCFRLVQRVYDDGNITWILSPKIDTIMVTNDAQPYQIHEGNASIVTQILLFSLRSVKVLIETAKAHLVALGDKFILGDDPTTTLKGKDEDDDDDDDDGEGDGDIDKVITRKLATLSHQENSTTMTSFAVDNSSTKQSSQTGKKHSIYSRRVLRDLHSNIDNKTPITAANLAKLGFRSILYDDDI